MKIKQVLVRVDDGSRFGSEVRIDFDRVGGEVTYFQSGASTEVLCFTSPIADKLLEMVFENEIEVKA